jgi:hypothetical protein
LKLNFVLGRQRKLIVNKLRWEFIIVGEHRQQLRVEWSSSGTIDVGNGHPRRDCVVSNLFKCGAKLGGVDIRTAPNEFTLHLVGKADSAYKCRVIWRSEHELGVEFAEALPNSFQLAGCRRVVLTDGSAEQMFSGRLIR